MKSANAIWDTALRHRINRACIGITSCQFTISREWSSLKGERLDSFTKWGPTIATLAAFAGALHGLKHDRPGEGWKGRTLQGG